MPFQLHLKAIYSKLVSDNFLRLQLCVRLNIKGMHILSTVSSGGRDRGVEEAALSDCYLTDHSNVYYIAAFPLRKQFFRFRWQRAAIGAYGVSKRGIALMGRRIKLDPFWVACLPFTQLSPVLPLVYTWPTASARQPNQARLANRP